MIRSEAVLGLPGYQITGIEEVAGMVRISARYEGSKACPDCGSQRLRLKDKRMREPRHECWGLRHCVLELESCKFRCKDCGRSFWQRFPGILPRLRATEPFRREVFVAHYDGANRSRLGKRMRIGSATVERWFQDHLRPAGTPQENVYLFLWTPELDHLLGGVPDRPSDPGEGESGPDGGGSSDRNTASAPDRNSCSGLDRKKPAGLERNTRSAPIGINSEGNTSLESSSSSECSRSSGAQTAEVPGEPEDERKNRTAQAIREWLASKGIKRLKSDRRVGSPEKQTLDQWARIMFGQGIKETSDAEAILDRAIAAANRAGPWRSWNFLTLQIQIAAEQCRPSTPAEARIAGHASIVRREEPVCDWKAIKSRIRERVSEIAFLNWFDETRQVERRGAALVVAVPDEATAAYFTVEYEQILRAAAASQEITQVRFVLPDGEQSANLPNGIVGAAIEAATINTQGPEVNSPAADEGSEAT